MVDKIPNVMIIDDDHTTVALTKIIFKRTDATDNLIVAYDGQEAIEYLERVKEGLAVKPDLILLDINMPRMDGFEFLDQYSQMPEDIHAETLIVMLTTSLLQADRDRATSNPHVTAFFNKPLDKEHVSLLLSLHRRRPR